MTVIVRRIRELPSWQVTLSAALLVLGFLIAAQLSAQGPLIRYTTQERVPLVGTVLGLQSQQDALKDQILSLRSQIRTPSRPSCRDRPPRRRHSTRTSRRPGSRAASPSSPAPASSSGSKMPGARSANSNADGLVTARDVRIARRGAVAGRGRGDRRSTTSGRHHDGRILDIGNSILVNSAYLAPPYQYPAIGPTDLYTRLSALGFVRGVRSGPDRPVRHPPLLRRARQRDRARPLPAPSSGRYIRPSSRPVNPRRGRTASTITVVAFVLGFLVVAQIRGQGANASLSPTVRPGPDAAGRQPQHPERGIPGRGRRPRAATVAASPTPVPGARALPVSSAPTSIGSRPGPASAPFRARASRSASSGRHRWRRRRGSPERAAERWRGGHRDRWRPARPGRRRRRCGGRDLSVENTALGPTVRDPGDRQSRRS